MERFAAGVRRSQVTLWLSHSEFTLDKRCLLDSFAMPCEEATVFNADVSSFKKRYLGEQTEVDISALPTKAAPACTL